ncbi:MAG: hypothetical protein J6Q85_01320 [Clostridia bacterium]|nr:hypothetical protein [Clostridia bacterium]
MDINNFEYAVMQKCVGKLKTRKRIIIFCYALFTVIYFTLVFASKLLPLGAVYPFLMYILVLATYKYVQIDNKYEILSGTMIFTRKYGNSKPKVLCEFKLKSAELVAPLEESKSEISSFAPKKIFDARSTQDAEGAYVALFRDNDGVPCSFCFEVTEEACRVLKYYSPAYRSYTTGDA